MLADQGGDAAHWKDIETELTDAYQRTAHLVEQAEKSAVDYNKLRKKIRPMAVLALRKLNKKTT
ncbi:hypothetical protein CHU00_06645 [Sphingobacterium cellulitidis]|uniref:hypothetical protein n=1 Tax=Sphingobacterium cellulitidis TaxID=1768011 RepID=UPI000B93A662|nr:hypothetical protein [Sphingobacterium cellulitidis]OYD46363.1 hypothetical protein CHU00_06645 [Sphingobacterium cellulitidis]